MTIKLMRYPAFKVEFEQCIKDFLKTHHVEDSKNLPTHRRDFVLFLTQTMEQLDKKSVKWDKNNQHFNEEECKGIIALGMMFIVCTLLDKGSALRSNLIDLFINVRKNGFEVSDPKELQKEFKSSKEAAKEAAKELKMNLANFSNIIDPNIPFSDGEVEFIVKRAHPFFEKLVNEPATFDERYLQNKNQKKAAVNCFDESQFDLKKFESKIIDITAQLAKKEIHQSYEERERNKNDSQKNTWKNPLGFLKKKEKENEKTHETSMKL